MCISWMRAVVREGTTSIGSASPLSWPPSPPLKAGGTIPISRAASSARMTSRLLPEVLKPLRQRRASDRPGALRRRSHVIGRCCFGPRTDFHCAKPRCSQAKFAARLTASWLIRQHNGSFLFPPGRSSSTSTRDSTRQKRSQLCAAKPRRHLAAIPFARKSYWQDERGIYL
jgi:hypothetical protein